MSKRLPYLDRSRPSFSEYLLLLISISILLGVVLGLFVAAVLVGGVF